MTYTFETRLATKFFTPDRPGVVKYIVIHWWGDPNVTFDAIVNFLASPTKTRQVSAHYAVQGTDRDGTINPRVAQVVLDEDIAWHAGNWTVNQESIGIECRTEARPADYEAVAELVKRIREKHGNIPLRAHKEFASTTCPGNWDLAKIDALARKEETTVAECKRATWRGVIVCAHSVPKLNAWAAAVGDDILLKPLPGCGSYQTSTTASAGTHAGGGAIDIDARNLSAEQRNRIEAKGRLSGFQVAWERHAISGLWTWHTHALDPSCPNLAKPAVSQVVEFGNGGDGLVGSNPDAGTRENVDVLMQMFKFRLVNVVGQITDDAKVRLLQQAVRRPVDGIWDLQTDIDLRNTRAEAIDKQYDGDYFKKWTLVQRKRMQKTWGAYQDGVWGPESARLCKNTVIAIQKALGVVSDGIWGTVTDAAYERLKAAKLRNFDFTKPTGAFPYPSAGAIYGPSTPGKPWYSGKVAGTKMTKSQINWQIKRIQRMVGAPVDGLYGTSTATKVKAFQKKYRLTVDGATGPQTWNKMVSLNKT